jgi:hypothetical protein
MGRACSTNGAKRMHIGYQCENQKERDHYGDQDVGRWIILKWILERSYGVVWTRLIWLRSETSGGLL